MDNFNPNGVLVINKPQDFTSFDVVAKIRRAYHTRSVGHTGTLDPMATGVLVVLVGNATKASEYVTSQSKNYEAVLRLGYRTDTGDITGKTLEETNFIPNENQVLDATKSFIGKSKQIPPMYSALKVDGKKLVDLARRGIEVEREPREIEVYSIKCNKISDTDYALDVSCSKGTYIRTLCEDIAKAAGSLGTMAALNRSRGGNFSIEDSHTIEEIEQMSDEDKISLLKPTESLFTQYPIITFNEFFGRLAHNGAEIYLKKIGKDFELNQKVRCYDENGFFALGEVREYEDGKAIKPIKFFIER